MSAIVNSSTSTSTSPTPPLDKSAKAASREKILASDESLSSGAAKDTDNAAAKTQALPRQEGPRGSYDELNNSLKRLGVCFADKQQPHLQSIMVMLLELSSYCMENWLKHQEQRIEQEKQLQSNQLDKRLPNQADQHAAEKMQYWHQLLWGGVGLVAAAGMSQMQAISNLAPAVPGVVSSFGGVLDRLPIHHILPNWATYSPLGKFIGLVFQPTQRHQALQRQEMALKGQDEGYQFRLQQLQDATEQLRNVAQRALQLLDAMSSERNRVLQQIAQGS